jgi:hypothetical protein
MQLTGTPDFKHHVERIKSATLNKHSLGSIPEWIEQNTFINGDPYSFKDHEYQERILRDTSKEVVIIKPSQVGISETSARLALALCAVVRGYTVAYTLPTAGFAATFMRTRIDPIIQGSPFLTSAIHTTTDNAEVKRIGDSYLYLKGSQSSNAPISVPCDHLIHDEVDFSDPEVISQYQSRLTHSRYKRKTKLSTPTIPNRGIHREFQRSRRYFNLIKCDHCGHHFLPDYYAHVKVPGFDDDLHKITKRNLHKFDYNAAFVQCPSCKGKPSLQPEHREWVCENPTEHFVAVGYQITPFDAPNIITPGYLIEQSTQYKRLTDFHNFGLGLPSEDKESTLSAKDFEHLLDDGFHVTYGSYVMGLDMGMDCHCLVGFISHDGFLVIVHSEVIPVGRVRQRRKELAQLYRPRVTVVDSQPYTETVLAMQEEDENLYGAVYIQSKNLETHYVRSQEEKEEDGKVDVRQLNVNRNRAFDAYMEAIRAGMIRKIKDENDQLWIDHQCDMKRVKDWTADQEIAFIWKKSEDGNDHFHHASLYLFIASMLLGVSKTIMTLPFHVASFRQKSEAEKLAAQNEIRRRY